MNWQSIVERTVIGLGYDPVDFERSSRGLLRVYIDKLPVGPAGEKLPAGPAGDKLPPADDGAAGADTITVEDCEKVTRQLQYVLEVEGVDYERLEVSSPGLDRPLRKPADWQRFAGSQIELTLRAPLAGRRKFSGTYEAHGEGWRLVFSDDGGKTQATLDFTLDEVREARLVPVVDFKRRRTGGAAAGGPQQ